MIKIVDPFDSTDISMGPMVGASSLVANLTMEEGDPRPFSLLPYMRKQYVVPGVSLSLITWLVTDGDTSISFIAEDTDMLGDVFEDPDTDPWSNTDGRGLPVIDMIELVPSCDPSLFWLDTSLVLSTLEDEDGDDGVSDDADVEAPTSFQYWMMYSVIKLFPSILDGIQVTDVPRDQIPSMDTFNGAEGTSIKETN